MTNISEILINIFEIMIIMLKIFIKIIEILAKMFEILTKMIEILTKMYVKIPFFTRMDQKYNKKKAPKSIFFFSKRAYKRKC